MMRGYTVLGNTGSKFINVAKGTAFFTSYRLEVPPHLQHAAEALLNPPSMEVSAETNLGSVPGFLTLSGKVVELTSVKKVGAGRFPVPMMSLTIEKDGRHFPVTLWREAATSDLVGIGSSVQVTHLKVKQGGTETLQSTNYTEIKTLDDITELEDHVIGCLDQQDEEELLILFQNGKEFLIGKEKWALYKEKLLERVAQVKITAKGRKIMEIHSIEE
ncbi:uncharacterized protein LOC117822356 [Notolabrus celidotus]|uniref:uncharacterized protein LOC117822356 n=1 Tax=Notolabrus celidotus TaxID=1203425 RepID=UPI0014906821|nr:uncharacterized protein LOC117822356 [Notolabrus celidotus]